MTRPAVPAEVAVRAIPTGAFFRLARQWASPAVYMLVHPEGLPLPKDHAPYGITYQPTNDENSVYAVDCSNGKLWRMLATLPCVREPRLTMQFRYDRSDLNYHLPGSDPDR
jgi:hypothetical protein